MRDIIIYATGQLEDKVVLRTDLIEANGNFTIMWTSGITEANSGLYTFKQGTVTSLGDIAVFVAENGLNAAIDSPGLRTPIPPAVPFPNDLKIMFVVDRETYYRNLPKHYTDRYPWADDPNIPNSLPWFVMWWDKVVSTAEMSLTIKKDGVDVILSNITDRLSSVSEDGKTFTTTLPMDVFWDMDAQMGITEPNGVYEVTATIGSTTKTFLGKL